jgi:hypothetical protein
LTKWQEHKAACPRSVHFSCHKPSSCSAYDSSPLNEHVAYGTSTRPPDASPSRSERSENRPPLSVASTEATAVDAAALLGSSKKRQRDSDEDESETRPRTRAKTQAESPSGALDWLLLPFRSFVNGFKKGIGQSGSESTAT